MVKRGGRRAICNYFETIDLRKISTQGLVKIRNTWTKQLVRDYEIAWGPARKAVNLFLRDLSYNFMTRKEYGLSKHDEDLEVPLDGKVMTRIRAEAHDTNLDRTTVIALTEEMSEKYQLAALKIAKQQKKVYRVDLDLQWWSARSE